MNIPPLHDHSAGAKGFSLVEMLTVISVIGIIAAIAIPSIGSITTNANTATARRNAQNLASIYQSGLADGITWGSPTGVSTAVAAVQTGATGSSGAFFAIKGLQSADVTAASLKLAWDAGAGLVYSP